MLKWKLFVNQYPYQLFGYLYFWLFNELRERRGVRGFVQIRGVVSNVSIWNTSPSASSFCANLLLCLFWVLRSLCDSIDQTKGATVSSLSWINLHQSPSCTCWGVLIGTNCLVSFWFCLHWLCWCWHLLQRDSLVVVLLSVYMNGCCATWYKLLVLQ